MAGRLSGNDSALKKGPGWRDSQAITNLDRRERYRALRAWGADVAWALRVRDWRPHNYHKALERLANERAKAQSSSRR